MKYLLTQEELDELKNADARTIEEVTEELKRFLCRELTNVVRKEHIYDSCHEPKIIVRLKDLQEILERFKPENKKTSP
jgi:hypothetical protein